MQERYIKRCLCLYVFVRDGFFFVFVFGLGAR